MKVKTSPIDICSLLLGFTSIASQIIIIRELMVVFYGNELSIGVTLASWLLWISAGSLLAGKLSTKFKDDESILSNVLLFISLAIPFHVFFIRTIKHFFDIPAGSLTSFSDMFLGSFLSLSFICLLLGFTFTLLAKIASGKGSSPAKAVGRVYLLEGAGASLGGVIFSVIIIKFFSPMQSVFLAAILNILTALYFRAGLIKLVFLSLLSVGFLFGWPSGLEKISREWQFAPFNLIESINSKYGNISVIKNRENVSLYENGLLFFTSGDLLAAEESAHYPMLQHPNPKKVLLIGGGTGGTLREILKHDIVELDYVELDPMLITLSEKYLGVPRDKRLTIHNQDGRLFVKQIREKKYDVIVSDLPDPYTATLNRFYSMEFFNEAKNILAPRGVLSLSLSSSENYINPERAFYLGSIYKTMKACFADVVIFPGDTAYFMGCKTKGVLTENAGSLIERLKKRDIATIFVREYYLPFKISAERMRFTKDRIETKNAEINRDMKPVGYLYHMLLWSSLFRSGENPINYLKTINRNNLVFIASVLFLALFLFQKTGRVRFKNMVRLSVATTGLTEISVQIITIMAFQFIYGYVYYKIGLILASFMGGLVLGSLCVNSFIDKIKNGAALYIKLQVLICLYPFLLPVAFSLNPGQTVFILLPLIAGLMGGFQYPLANKLCLGQTETAGKNAGYLYGLDLLGSSAGAIITGILLVPLLGITGSCILLAVINIFILILLRGAPGKDKEVPSH